MFVAEVVGREQAADVLPGLEVVDLVGREEARGQGRSVDEEEDAGDADGDGEDAFEDEDLDTWAWLASLGCFQGWMLFQETHPSPSFESGDTIHLGNGKCKQAGKGATCSGRSVQDGDAGLRLIGKIPLADDKNGTREEAGSRSEKGMSVSMLLAYIPALSDETYSNNPRKSLMAISPP